ncbi:MAG: class I SAM-dependent methyltransferase [Bryobacteraceae bacterium]
MSEFIYQGSELPVFEHAVRWKAYFVRTLAPLVRGDVLEVGAGLGATSLAFASLGFDRWLALEPDAGLFGELSRRLGVDPRYEARSGTVADLDGSRRFDTAMYIDVLEHIDGDRAELDRTARLLKPGGALIVLAPAHPWLYSEFDRAIGHVQRYTRQALERAAGPLLRLERMFFLDAVGLVASAANRLLLRSGHPTVSQIQFWDRALIPCSRVLDPLLGRRLGRSIIGVWSRVP